MRLNGFGLNIDSIDAMRYRRGDLIRYSIYSNTLYLFKLGDEYDLFVHGRIYSNSNTPDQFMMEDGNFAFIKFDNHVIFGRDILGTKPLYYSIQDGLRLASDARVLRKPEVAEPGIIYRYDGNLKSHRVDLSLDHDTSDPIHKIIELLTRSIKRRMEGRCLIGLSGIDSMILARLADADQAIVCMKGSYDHNNAKALSDQFDLKILIIDDEIIKNALKHVSNIIPFHDAMNLSIAVTFHILARYAYEHDYDSIMLGQLADELFGGYARYLSIDRRLLNKVLYDDVMNAWRINLTRDEMIVSEFVELLLPYTSLELVRYVLSLDADLKIRGSIRKFILREVARELGIDDKLVREKKAIQYSSGISKVVTKYISHE